MNYYLLVTQSDKGILHLKTNASSKDVAIENFCNLYNAPKNAVKEVYQFDLMWWNSAQKNIINKLGKLC